MNCTYDNESQCNNYSDGDHHNADPINMPTSMIHQPATVVTHKDLPSEMKIRHQFAKSLGRSQDLPRTKRPPERRSVCLRLDFDHTASVAILRRRYVMKPTPANPRIIIPQVEGGRPQWRPRPSPDSCRLLGRGSAMKYSLSVRRPGKSR